MIDQYVWELSRIYRGESEESAVHFVYEQNSRTVPWDERARKVMCLVSFTFVGGERNLKPESIIYVQTEGHRNVFHVLDVGDVEQYRLYRKLDEVEDVLRPYGFVRCHRSCLVNMRYVRTVNNYLMQLTTGEVFTIPRSKYRTVKEEFSRFIVSTKKYLREL